MRYQPHLSSMLGDLPAVRGHAPWPDHEYVKGWGVIGLPFDSGHVLALRVFPETASVRTAHCGTVTPVAAGSFTSTVPAWIPPVLAITAPLVSTRAMRTSL